MIRFIAAINPGVVAAFCNEKFLVFTGGILTSEYSHVPAATHDLAWALDNLLWPIVNNPSTPWKDIEQF